MSIRARLVEIVINYANAEITDKVTFMDLGFDSLDAVELTMDVEDEFDLKISDEEAGTLKTFGDAVTFVESKLKHK